MMEGLAVVATVVFVAILAVVTILGLGFLMLCLLAGPDEEVMVEYDWAAGWCAEKGYQGADDEPLPNTLSVACRIQINENREAFQKRIAYKAEWLERARVPVPSRPT